MQKARGESLEPQFAFHSRGKKNRHVFQCWSISGDEERHAACPGATMDPGALGPMWKGLALSPQQSLLWALHQALQAWPASGRAPGSCQAKQQLCDHQTWNSTSYRTASFPISMCRCIRRSSCRGGKSIYIYIKWVWLERNPYLPFLNNTR